MMTGKAFRGHMLVDCSLTSLLLAEVFCEQRKGSKREANFDIGASILNLYEE